MSAHSRFQPNRPPCGQTRRQFLWQVGGGFTALPLIDLLSGDGFFQKYAQGAEPDGDQNHNLFSEKDPHFPARAKHVIFFFMQGGPSQVDTFDPKPALKKYAGKPYGGNLQIGSNARPIGHTMPSPFPFTQRGESGLPISSLYPHVGRFADDLCVIRSMYAETPTHSPGILQMNTGSFVFGRPSLGAWLSYGLGTENDDLPSYVVMTDPRGGPRGGAAAWSAGFMPAAYQGTMFRSQGSPLLNLATPAGLSPGTQRRSLDLLERLNHQHLQERPGDSELVARVRSYELAYRMQTSAADAVDLDREDEKTKDRYGLSDDRTAVYGRQCLLTRRLIERGVRYVQLYSGGGLHDWDAHTDCPENHTQRAGETDQPIAALMHDLKARGLWDETLLIWGGEFGRTPTSEGVGKPGRDHNHHGFSMWLAGGGVKGGQTIGTTDELGFKAVEERFHVSDLHATILHLMGLDHTQLTYLHEGLQERATGVEERHVIRKALA